VTQEAGRKRSFRFQAFGWLKRNQITLLGVLAGAVVVLSYIGARSPGGLDFAGALYAALRSLVGGNPWGTYGTPGDVASYLDLLLASGIAAKAFVLAFANGADALLARPRGGHMIVCGLGQRGRVLTEALLSGGAKVTVLEIDAENRHIGGLRALGARVVIGDAMTPAGLRAAGCRRARRVVAVLPNDDDNAAVVQALVGTGEKRPPVLVHNSDTSLWSMLFDLAGDDITPFSVTDSSCADVFLECDLAGGQDGTVLAVYGTGPLAESIIIRAAKVWQAESHRRGTPSRLPVRVVGPNADGFSARRLAFRYPGIEELCDLEPIAISSFDTAEDVMECSAGERVTSATMVIVATGDRETTVRCAMLLARCVPSQCGIVAALPATSGLLDLLRSHDEGLAERVRPVDLHGALENPSTLLGGKREEFARLAHEDWLRAQLAGGKRMEGRGSLRHWEDLPEGLKASNRHQIANLYDRMLPKIAIRVVPVAEWEPEVFEFSGEELELLAEAEHARWSDDRVADGWVLDRTLMEGDVERKRSPWLVGWGELPEDMKQWDRETIERFPVLLARAGFRLKRIGPASD
jgi:voltage-gated potassium channel Kch